MVSKYETENKNSGHIKMTLRLSGENSNIPFALNSVTRASAARMLSAPLRSSQDLELI